MNEKPEDVVNEPNSCRDNLLLLYSQIELPTNQNYEIQMSEILGKVLKVSKFSESAKDPDSNWSPYTIDNKGESSQIILEELDAINLYMNEVSCCQMINGHEEIELAKIIETGKSIMSFKSNYISEMNQEPTGTMIMLWLIDRVLDYESLIRLFAVKNGLSKNMSLAQMLTSHILLTALEKEVDNETIQFVEKTLSITNASELLKSICAYVKPLQSSEIDRIASKSTGIDLKDLRSDSGFIKRLDSKNQELEAHFKLITDNYIRAQHAFIKANLRLVVDRAINYVGKAHCLLS